KFYPSLSADGGKTWTPHTFGSFSMDLPAKVKVGVGVSNTASRPLNVSFEDFQITRRGPPPPKEPASRTIPDWGDFYDTEHDCQATVTGKKLVMEIPGGVYHDLSPGKGTVNAPMVLQEVNGDFIVQVKVASLSRAEIGTANPGIGNVEYRSAA